MIFNRIFVASVLAVAVLILDGAVVFAQTPSNTQSPPAAFSADEMTHDQDLGVITARGNVEINYEQRTLLADTISYNEGKDLITAKGNVTLQRVNGDVIFADFMEVTGDLKNGLIQDLRAVMADRSRFAAKQATLVNDETMTLDNSSYTRCEPCKEDPTRSPLWQVKAIKVIHDRKNKVIEYMDAWLEFAGVPVLYTPYLSTPDPSVKRKTGLLTPSFKVSSDTGASVKVPYFYVVDDHSDVTLTPIFSSSVVDGGIVEYRQRLSNGNVSLVSSAARGAVTGNSTLTNEKKQMMGHIAAKADFDLNRTWRAGVNLDRTNNDTYMRRYGFGNEPTLISQAYVEGFRGGNYASVRSIAFQGLGATDNAKTTPLVLPVAEFNHQGVANKYGAYNTVDINATLLRRELGADSTRISVRPAWNISHIAPMGDVYNLSASMGVDFFHAQSLAAPAARGGTYDGAALRVTPQVAFDWRWPLARRSGTVTEVIEPIGQVIVSPYGGNSYKMANEDSQDFDFNDANLFTANRFTGYDRVEGGPRANYGVKWSVTGDGGGHTSMMVGQSYRMKADDTFSVGSGLEDNFSDYVGKLDLSPINSMNMLYRTRVDKSTLAFKRHELGLNGSAWGVGYGANYVFFDATKDGQFTGRKQVDYSLSSPLTKYWSTSFSGMNDLRKDGGLRNVGLGFTYDDECFNFTANFSRSFFSDREIKPADAVVFNFVFKTLGEFTTGSLTPSLVQPNSKSK